MKYYFLLLLILFIYSCASDSEEALVPVDNNCDSTNVSYINQVEPILQNSCIGCHNASFPEGGILLDSYESVKEVAETGMLLGVINHSTGYSPMPKNTDKLDDCSIAIINAWINEGIKEN